jgi:peptidoglycan/LPS O-acetylase OafA/YrhL
MVVGALLVWSLESGFAARWPRQAALLWLGRVSYSLFLVHFPVLESYFFYFWNEERNEIRLVTSFDTTEEDVDEFIRLLKR